MQQRFLSRITKTNPLYYSSSSEEEVAQFLRQIPIRNAQPRGNNYHAQVVGQPIRYDVQCYLEAYRKWKRSTNIIKKL